MGCVFAPAFSTATLGVDGHEAGIASAMVNTSQQVGGSVGTSLLSTIFASSAASYTASHIHLKGLAGAAAVHGYTTAFWWAAGIFAIGLLLALLILPGRTKPRAPTLKAALARHAIGNCHHAELANGAARITRRGIDHRLAGDRPRRIEQFQGKEGRLAATATPSRGSRPSRHGASEQDRGTLDPHL
jgi:hypothetical protein